MPDISQERWKEAQSLELGFWDGLHAGAVLKFAGHFAGVVELIGPERGARLFDGKDLLDVGSGPLALNIAALYPHADRIRRWAAAEPLPRTSLRQLAERDGQWAGGFLHWLDQRLSRIEYHRESGEALSFDAEFDTVTCVNVLDHVRQPEAILRNIHRALRSGGRLLLGVDCLSVLGQIKFDGYLRRRHPNAFIVGAHPFTFRVAQVRRMLRRCGFTLEEVLGAPSPAAALYGRAHHPFFLCRK
jgi:SAM-dependent methyltransferase